MPENDVVDGESDTKKRQLLLIDFMGEDVSVRTLIESLERFDPNMPVVIGAEGVFQGPPMSLAPQRQKDGEIALVIWGDC